jgi:circadian clock protein KaiC
MIEYYKPSAIVVDPISNLISIGDSNEVHALFVRLIDLLKNKNITSLFTSLSRINEGTAMKYAEESVSSLIDTWVVVRDVEGSGRRKRGIYIIKARGMAHSNHVHEFVITNKGLQIAELN